MKEQANEPGRAVKQRPKSSEIPDARHQSASRPGAARPPFATPLIVTFPQHIIPTPQDQLSAPVPDLGMGGPRCRNTPEHLEGVVLIAKKLAIHYRLAPLYSGSATALQLRPIHLESNRIPQEIPTGLHDILKPFNGSHWERDATASQRPPERRSPAT